MFMFGNNKLPKFEKTSKYVRGLIRDQLWLKVLVGLFMGLVAGAVLGPDLNLMARESALTISSWLAFPGYLFLSVIKMIVIPLVLASVVRGIADTQNVDAVQSMGLKVVFYFLFTTSVAVAIGAGIANVINPGHYIDPGLVKEIMSTAAAPDGVVESFASGANLPQQIVSVIPTNPFASLVGGDMLQIVIFAAVLGAALLMMPRDKARPLLEFAASIQEACMVIVGWVMRLAPYAVFGLIADVASKTGVEALSGVAIYMGTVVLGLVAVFVFYMVLLALFSQHSPWWFVARAKNAQLLAFSTSSSAATMPVTLKIAEEELGIRPLIARFIVPLGTTINMDGTALYQTIATIFWRRCLVLISVRLKFCWSW